MNMRYKICVEEMITVVYDKNKTEKIFFYKITHRSALDQDCICHISLMVSGQSHHIAWAKK